MSSYKTSIRCHCGQRIIARDVLQTGFYLRLFGPSYVYVKYRCSRCKKLGEQFIKQEEWESGILRAGGEEVTIDDRDKFEALGPIDINEVIDFHFALENSSDIKGIEGARSPGRTPSPKTKQRSTNER